MLQRFTRRSKVNHSEIWSFVKCRFLTSSCFHQFVTVLGFATYCPCGVWCRGLNTFLLYVGPLFGNLVWNDSGFVNCHSGEQLFQCFRLCSTYSLVPHSILISIFIYLVFTSQIVLYCLQSTLLLSFYIDVVLTLGFWKSIQISLRFVLKSKTSPNFHKWADVKVMGWYWTVTKPCGGGGGRGRLAAVLRHKKLRNSSISDQCRFTLGARITPRWLMQAPVDPSFHARLKAAANLWPYTSGMLVIHVR